MKKHLYTAFCTAAVLLQSFAVRATALDAEVLPLNNGISLFDKSGKIYIHMQSSGSLDVKADKAEPEGIFRYYDTKAINTSQQQKSFLMDLSCCEYLVDSGEYASSYNLNMNVSSDKNSCFEQTIIITDPGFDSIEISEYHFYVTLKPSKSSGCIVTKLNDTSKDGVYICNQYLEFSYAPLAGDANSDGIVNISDATAVLDYYARKAADIAAEEFTEEQKISADMNSDGNIDISDATDILKIYAENAANI